MNCPICGRELLYKSSYGNGWNEPRVEEYACECGVTAERDYCRIAYHIPEKELKQEVQEFVEATNKKYNNKIVDWKYDDYNQSLDFSFLVEDDGEVEKVKETFFLTDYTLQDIENEIIADWVR